MDRRQTIGTVTIGDPYAKLRWQDHHDVSIRGGLFFSTFFSGEY
jgi:hypothetical protein